MSEPKTAAANNAQFTGAFVTTHNVPFTIASGYAAVPFVSAPQDLARAHELRFKAKITETLRLYLQDESAIKELSDALYSVIESNRA